MRSVWREVERILTPAPPEHTRAKVSILSLSKDALGSSRHRRKSKKNSAFDACILPLQHILRQAQDEERVERGSGKGGAEFFCTHPRKGLQDEESVEDQINSSS